MPRPTTPDNRAIIKEQLTKMLEANIIRISQHPRYYSQVHMVKYANKEPRFTIGSFSTPFLIFLPTTRARPMIPKLAPSMTLMAG